MKNMYIVVELDGANIPGMAVNLPDGRMRMFASLEKAEAWLREDAKDTIAGSEMDLGRMQDWGTPVAICKVVRVCRPVPVVSVKIEIQEVKQESEAKNGR
jgi:hypothetical protein